MIYFILTLTKPLFLLWQNPPTPLNRGALDRAGIKAPLLKGALDRAGIKASLLKGALDRAGIKAPLLRGVGGFCPRLKGRDFIFCL